ncbi:MAG: FkbM family methyltransferase [Alphaproteobacteria bacterium]
MNLVRALARPEYLHRPRQIVERLRYAYRSPQGEAWARTPWGLPVWVDAQELHGRALLTHGVVDLGVTEVIWRLVEPGDAVVDVGANVGGLTAAMARRVGRGGSVVAFEPHPATRALLERSAERWSSLGAAPVVVRAEALSSTEGTARLHVPEAFARNSGIARLVETGDGVDIPTTTFDRVFARDIKLKLVKIDVEGHEDAVVEGMRETLTDGRVEHIVFEEFRPLPSPLCMTLTTYGFEAFLIDTGIGGPSLLPVDGTHHAPSGRPPNVLATRSSRDALVRLQPRGFACLGAR